MHPQPVSPSSAELIQLLQSWSRKTIHQALAQVEYRKEALLNGEVARLLRTRRKRRKPWPCDFGPAVVGWFDDAFPALLTQIPDPPVLLGYRGNLAALQKPSVAIVGARRCTTQGRRWAQTVASELSRAGCCVVSGLALGIDGASHGGAVSAGAATVAFVGSGLAQVYPARHRALADQMLHQGGALISEYPATFDPFPSQFPERNRLISGVAMAVVVVEASERSGSLITARLALEQGRDVLAVPGPVGSWVSHGCHRLIKQGAALVTDADDILQSLGVDFVPTTQAHEPSVGEAQALASEGIDSASPEALVLRAFGQVAINLDEIIAETGRSQAEVVQALVTLELSGFVEQGSLGYIRSSKFTTR